MAAPESWSLITASSHEKNGTPALTEAPFCVSAVTSPLGEFFQQAVQRDIELGIGFVGAGRNLVANVGDPVRPNLRRLLYSIDQVRLWRDIELIRAANRIGRLSRSGGSCLVGTTDGLRAMES